MSGVTPRLARRLSAFPIHLRTQQVEQPADVGRRHEMQRPAHQPGADDRARLDPFAVHVGSREIVRARPDRQQLAHRILRLHRPDRPRQLSDASIPTRPKQLRRKPHASGLFSGQLHTAPPAIATVARRVLGAPRPCASRLARPPRPLGRPELACSGCGVP